MDDDLAVHHVGADRPARVAVHLDVETIGEGSAEVADVAAEDDPRRGEDPDREAMA